MSGEHEGHVRNWIWRSLKKVLVRPLVCGGALSSCTTSSMCPCQGAQCNVAHVGIFQHSNAALCVDATAFLDETRRDKDAFHDRGAHHGAWDALAMLVDAYVGRSPSAQTTQIGLFWRGPVQFQRKNFSRQRTPRASCARASKTMCHGPKERARAAARHGKSSIIPSGFPLSISAHALA